MTLRERRMVMGLNQKDFARRCGCSPTYMSRVERGLATPSAPMAEIIKKVLAGERVVDNRPMQGGKKLVPFRDDQEKAILRKIWLRDYA